MNTSIVAQPKQAVSLASQELHGIDNNKACELTRKIAALPERELRDLHKAISGWLESPIKGNRLKGESPGSGPRGWIEQQMKPKKRKGVIVEGKFNGPYYARCWWEPMTDGKRKKGRVYIGKSLSGLRQEAK